MERDRKQGELGQDALYKVAYEEGVRALSEQRAAIESVRSHAGMLLSAAAITTSFLGAQALRDGSLSPAAWAALASFVAVAVLSLTILRPRRWEFAADPSELIRGYIEAEESAPIENLHRDLSLHMHGSHLKNRESLHSLAGLFRAATALLIAEVLLWIVAIASVA